MLETLGTTLTRWTGRYLPSPFVLAILLTLLAFALALVHVGFDVQRVLLAWVDGSGKVKGFWNLLTFGMQMCLILVTGHALASSPPMRRGLDRLAAAATSAPRAIGIVAVSAMMLGLINWGLGLIGGALLARRVGLRAQARGVRVHYPLLAAAGYTGLLVWHGGLSGSAPLKVTLERDLQQILGETTAQAVGVMSLGETIGATSNLVASAVLIMLVPWLLIRMLPRDPSTWKPAGVATNGNGSGRQSTEVDEHGGTPRAVNVGGGAPALPAVSNPLLPAERLGHSRVLAWLVCLLGLATWVLIAHRQGLGRLDPNLINFLFLFLGMALHGSLTGYANAIIEATEGCAGIILQFPFYAGIMGLLAGTGLLSWLTGAVAQGGGVALPALSFYSAGLVNIFVPSGGGQWAVQGPILMDAAVRTGVEPARIVMALAYGDEWTNMLQPFWALPLLSITGVKARDIIGYTVVLLLISQIVFLSALYVGW